MRKKLGSKSENTKQAFKKKDKTTFNEQLFKLSFWKFIIALAASSSVYYLLKTIFMRNLEAQNMLSDTSDINQYKNDQHIMLPEEMFEMFDFFPDAGAHSAVQVSSMISHVALKNKGLDPFKVSKKHKKDTFDEKGNPVHQKHEIVMDQEDNIIYDTKPRVDEDFMNDLFTTSGVEDKDSRRFFDPKKIPYNPGNRDRDRLKGYDTLADLMNKDWELPHYEFQRPAGAYVVDTQPVNTMVLAITRAGKGQTVIEPTIDMWLREKRANNIVVNDPKGELLLKFFVPATLRGFEVVQFNLINSLKTDIYNPLVLAANAAREGDFVKCAMFVENIANVFFPIGGGEDPFWPSAANNAFKRAAYGLIDFYLEEEKELRRQVAKNSMNKQLLETKVDELWGKVTLYNCYQLFVRLSSKKKENPGVQFNKDVKAGKYDVEKTKDPEAFMERQQQIVTLNDDVWFGNEQSDMLSLYFNATDVLPLNPMRSLISDANNSLKAMGGSEKTISSVYGIAITSMNFFTDPTISRLTSGAPSQNVDLAGVSFPRRFGVRLASKFIEDNSYIGMQAEWQAYEDKNFEKSLGKEFYHIQIIDHSGWARFYMEGKLLNDVSYFKCTIKNPQTDQHLKSFYFKFTKGYQVSLDGTRYVQNPILNEKISRDGILEELVQRGDRFVKGSSKFTDRVIRFDENHEPVASIEPVNIITQDIAKYSDKTKAIFLVTPPHLMKYAKLILILIKQMVDLNFDQSYLTKENQKPLYRTRYMLDEKIFFIIKNIDKSVLI